MFKTNFLAFIAVALVISACTSSSNNKQREIDQKVDKLLIQMTLEEKAGQMTQVDVNYLDDPNDIKTYHLGSILSGGNSKPKINSPKGWLEMVNGFQEIALQGRLGIPIIYGVDAVHGHNNVLGATVFPQNLALGAANDSDLVFRINKATAVEVAATGIHWTFSPCITIPKDPRWGRFYEGFGQTTELVDGLTKSAVTGYQVQLTEVQNKQVAACAKHFIGDGATSWGTATRQFGMHTYMLDRGDVQLDDKTLRDLYLPPYKTAIAAGVKTIMASYNSVRGEKCHGSKYLLTDVLKDELGFEGFVVSDWAAIDEIPGDYKSDVINSINAGIDMVMVPGVRGSQEQQHYKVFIKHLIEAVTEGSVPMERIDDAVRRILKVKMELGLFDNPYKDDSHLSEVGSSAHRALAREAVQKSAVLLKNSGLLPLPKSSSITVVGSGANNLGVQNGGWTTKWQGIFKSDYQFLDLNADGTLTSAEYMNQLQKIYEDKFDVSARRSEFNRADQNKDQELSIEEFSFFTNKHVLQPEGTSILNGLKEVAPQAKISYDPNAVSLSSDDVVIAVVGEYPYAEGYGDDADLSLNKLDKEILDRVYASGNPLIVIVLSGRPLIVHDHLDNWDAFLASFLPGMAGEGIADVVFGDAEPSGRLNFTWPISSEGEGVLFAQGSGMSFD
jgi:beta-glucosidase-like glycosyl hydrolase